MEPVRKVGEREEAFGEPPLVGGVVAVVGARDQGIAELDRRAEAGEVVGGQPGGDGESERGTQH